MEHADAQASGHKETPLLQATRKHVLQLWNEQHNPRLVYHNFSQAASVAEKARQIAVAEGLSDFDQEKAQIAAWFHNIGYLFDRHGMVETSAIRAEFFLAEQQCPPDIIQEIRQSIVAAQSETQPITQVAQVLSDALLATNWVAPDHNRLALLRLETELIQGENFSEADWEQHMDRQLQAKMFFTAYGKKTFEPALANRILQPM